MLLWRITKYNPRLRNSKGHYLKNDWTACSDIGKIYDGKQFDIAQYMEIENAYVSAIMALMSCLNIDSLRISGLEKHMHEHGELEYTPLMIEVFKSLKLGGLVPIEQIGLVVRLALREDLWCMLESDDMHVQFGYDYYMYIGSKKSCKNAIQSIEESGLFVERIEELPYHKGG